MSKVRKPAVSGTFYPNNEEELDQMLNVFFNQAFELESTPKAIIAPHAGYVYSGSVAASAYKVLEKLKNKINKIILFGPSHRVAFDGLAFPSSDYFETPLGKVKIDQKTIKKLEKFEQVIISDKAHENEHSLEVHLPFLQKIFGNKFELIPAVIGHSNPDKVAEILEELWGDDKSLIIISTDLSHYHTYEEAYEIDKETCRDVRNLNFENLYPEKMCGSLPVSGLLNLARKKDLKVRLVDFSNSGDTEIANVPIDKNRVVGYASFYVGKEKDLGYFMAKSHKKELLRIARRVITESIENNYQPPEYLDSAFYFEEGNSATFVTLEIDGKLRGCIGSLEAHRHIIEDVAFNAFSAAFLDPRFTKLTKDELDKTEISISILTKPQPLEFKDEKDLLKKIRPKIDGLILIEGKKRGTFLPSVWKDLPKKEDFLNHLKNKAGLPENYWSNKIKIQRYITDKFSETDF